MNQEKYSLSYVREKLRTDQKWIERAIIRLFEFQTKDEQRLETTKYRNGIGFSACDSRRLSYYAKWILRGRNLSGRHLEKARAVVPKYAGQVLSLIESRQNCNHVN